MASYREREHEMTAPSREDRQFLREARRLAAQARAHQQGITLSETVLMIDPTAEITKISIETPKASLVGKWRARIQISTDTERLSLWGVGATAFEAQLSALEKEVSRRKEAEA